MNEKGSMTYENPWGAAKAVLRGKLIAINTLRNKKELKLTTSLYTPRQ